MRVLKQTVITTILLRFTGDMSVQFALIRCDFSLQKRSFILQAARLQLVYSALSGPRYLAI
jgi:hypothetical protein